MAGVGLAPRRSMATENIRDLQPWTCQQRRALGRRLVFGFVVRLLLGRVFDLVLLGPQWLEAVERAHDLAEPDVVLLPTQKAQLSTLIEALFIEVAAALATGEASDEQDHR